MNAVVSSSIVGKPLPSVVHFGWSKFAPAFIGRMLQNVLENGYENFGVTAINRSDSDPHFRRLSKSDHLYYLMECNGKELLSPIQVMTNTMVMSKQLPDIMDLLASDETRIVTLSVTNKGYSINEEMQPDTAVLDQDALAIKMNMPCEARTTMGIIAAGLHRRYSEGKPPFMVLSCDNILYNGDLAKRVIQHVAEQISPDFAAYVNEQVLFPNSVVDRVTPKQDFERQAEFASLAHGLDGIAPIKCEHHIQWVIENTDNKFPEDIREAFTKAGVEFTQQIKPHQDTKLKIFNAAHMVCGVFGSILRVPSVQDAMEENTPMRAFIDRFLGEMADGLRPSLPAIDDYVKQTNERLSNRSFTDEVSRLIAATITKLDPRFFNSDGLAEGTSTQASSFAIAMWMEYIYCRDNSGNHINIDVQDHRRASELGLRYQDSDQRPPIEQRLHVMQEILLAKQRTMAEAGELPAERLAKIEAAMPAFIDNIKANVALIEEMGPLNALNKWLKDNKAMPVPASNVVHPLFAQHGR